MKHVWEWKTLGLGWSVLWRAAFWGGVPMVVLVALFWPESLTSLNPWVVVSNLTWILWIVMAEGIAVRLAMNKWSGRLAPLNPTFGEWGQGPQTPQGRRDG